MSDWSRREPPSERIEIELTPVDARPVAARAIAPASQQARSDPTGESGRESPAEPPDEDGQSHDSVGRRTVVVTAAVVALSALVIGWVVGRGGNADNAAAEETSPPTTVEVTTTERIADTIAPPPTTVRPRPSTTTTTTLPAGTAGLLPLPPELRELPYELAVSTYDGELHRIELGAGTIRTYGGSRNEESYLEFSADGDLLVFSPWMASSLRSITLDGAENWFGSSEANRSQSTQVVVDGVGVVWLVTADDLASNISGTDAAHEVIQLPEGVFDLGGAVGDPAGGLLAYVSGDVFDINANGSARITTGVVVALGVDKAIAHECDETLVCTHVVIDRTNGERQPFPLQEIVNQALPPITQVATDARTTIQYGGFGTQATVAGNTAVVGVSTTNGTSSFGGLAVIDLIEQRVAGVLADTYGPVALTDDGLWVFSVGNDTGLLAFEVASGETYQFGPESTQGFNSLVVQTK